MNWASDTACLQDKRRSACTAVTPPSLRIRCSADKHSLILAIAYPGSSPVASQPASHTRCWGSTYHARSHTCESLPCSTRLDYLAPYTHNQGTPTIPPTTGHIHALTLAHLCLCRYCAQSSPAPCPCLAAAAMRPAGVTSCSSPSTCFTRGSSPAAGDGDGVDGWEARGMLSRGELWRALGFSLRRGGHALLQPQPCDRKCCLGSEAQCWSRLEGTANP